MSACRCRRYVCTAVLVASVASGSDGDLSWGEPWGRSEETRAKKSTRSESKARVSTIMTDAAPRWPTVHRRLSGNVTTALSTAIPIAQEQLRDSLSCRALFASLGADGLARLNATSYYPASAKQERKYCRGNNFAITTVGGSDVVLCRGFARLSGRQAAIILIHEALHFAGQSEYPIDRQAPDAVGITKMVMQSCGLS
jgi:hypothetical protein